MQKEIGFVKINKFAFCGKK